MFPDKVLNAMTSPTLVRKPGSDGYEGEPCIPIAYIGTCEDDQGEDAERGNEKYVELNRNRVFYSMYAEPEIAYGDYIRSLKRMKESKEQHMVNEKAKAQEKMMIIMKGTVIAYLENIQTRASTRMAYEEIPNILTRNLMVFQDVLDTYFAVGLRMGQCVNNPRKVYSECVEKYSEDIKNILSGAKRMTDPETEIYAIAAKFFKL